MVRIDQVVGNDSPCHENSAQDKRFTGEPFSSGLDRYRTILRLPNQNRRAPKGTGEWQQPYFLRFLSVRFGQRSRPELSLSAQYEATQGDRLWEGVPNSLATSLLLDSSLHPGGNTSRRGPSRRWLSVCPDTQCTRSWRTAERSLRCRILSERLEHVPLPTWAHRPANL